MTGGSSTCIKSLPATCPGVGVDEYLGSASYLFSRHSFPESHSLRRPTRLVVVFSSCYKYAVPGSTWKQAPTAEHGEQGGLLVGVVPRCRDESVGSQ